MIEVTKKTCPVCGEEINADATVCPICHEAQNSNQPKQSDKISTKAYSYADKVNAASKSSGCGRIILVVLIIIATIGAIVYFVSKPSNSSSSSSEQEADSLVVIEETPIYETDVELVDPIDTVPYYYESDYNQQNSYSEDNTIHNLDEY